MEPLPAELWERITQLSGREDLLNLSLVSPMLRDIARRALAENITFDGARKGLDYHAVLKFLRDENLAVCVRKFRCKRINMCRLRAHDTMVPFEDMTNLESLSFTRYSVFFGTEEDQKTFVDAIRRCCGQLVRLSLEWDYLIPGDHFAIPNLQMITWDDGGNISDSFLSLGHASSSTLTELNLTVYISHAGAERYVLLSKLYFPKLRVLTFGTGGQYMTDLRPEDDHTAQGAYTAFLYNHKTIERLTLTHRYIGGDEDETYLPFDSDTLPQDILPNLTYLTAHPVQMLQFIESGADMFAQDGPLLTLCISGGPYHDLAGDWRNVCIALREYASENGPVCIRRLVFNRGTSRSLGSGAFDACLGLAASALPDLDTWEGDVPRACSKLQGFRDFHKLCKLRVRRVRRDPAAVWLLAQDSCHLLKEVYYGADDDGYEVKRTGDQVVGLVPVGSWVEPGHD